jgi:signal transduction histidine kinase
VRFPARVIVIGSLPGLLPALHRAADEAARSGQSVMQMALAGLGLLFVAGGGFIWALREKLKGQRSEAAMIHAHNASLEARVAERTAELAAANERLSRASGDALATLAKERELGDMKSNFVSMVSHEFRTPLAVILSSTELLTNHLDRLPAERRAQQLASIRGSTQQLARLIEEVLLLGRVEAGRMTFNPAALHLRGFCRTLADEALSAGSRRGPVILTIAQEIPEWLIADAPLLRHIFSNLLSNAAKYSPPDSELHWDVQRKGDRIVFEISDQGIGIPAGDMDSLFVPFHRAKNVGQVTGTGLGLMIAKRCVELHGGSIVVVSNPGEGTRVTVSIPLHSATTTS